MVIGKTVSHYRILNKIGEGGMGVVYKAEDTRLHRTVALKFISPDRFGHPEIRTRFEHEACAAASLRHPHINTIFEIDEQEGRPFIAMEYVDGITLKEKILERPLPLNEALRIAIQVTDGLAEAHSQGVIHRDIKSSNILIDKKGQARIMDFGLAQTPEQTRMTGTATLLGTVAYMSPEQAGCEKLDARTDIWSLGVVIYEMLAGEPPFRGGSDQVILYSMLNSRHEPLTARRRGIPMEMERIIDKCLSKEKRERYQTAADLRADLVRLRRDLSSGRVQPAEKGGKSRGMRWIWSAAVVCAAAAAASLLYNYRSGLGSGTGISGGKSVRLIAVLPISFNGIDGDFQAMCSGLTAAVTNQLSRLDSLRGSVQVVPMRDVIKCRADSSGMARKALGADLVITGHAALVQDRLRLMLGISRTDPPREIQADRIEASPSEVRSIYDQTLASVLKMISLEIAATREIDVDEWADVDPDAVIFYYQGCAVLQSAFEDPDKIEEAVRLFQKAVDKDQEFAPAYSQLGNAYWDKWFVTKDPVWGEMAEANARKAAEMRPNDGGILTSLGAILIERGLEEEAGAHIKKALSLFPDSPASHRIMAKWHASRGEDLLAEQDYRKAVLLNPVYWSGYYDLALFLYSRGKIDDAERECRNILSLAPDNFEAHVLMGSVHYLKRDIDSAIRSFRDSIRIRPNSYACSNLATIYFFYRQDYSQARDMYLKAIEMGEGKFTIWGNLADAHRLLGDDMKAVAAYRQAVVLAESALEVTPRDGEAWAKFARYHACLGNEDAAEDCIERALALEPESARVALIGIQTYHYLGRRAEALACLEDYLGSGGTVFEIEINPDLKELREDPGYGETLSRFRKNN